ncbi:hypothetical protein [Achromobacter xylosoxidans]|uniref:hypothetical protein n=1 Tax=Alcaligenes xylosoxydans xylosoxydans TaxID=85698 RepID=UPI000761F75B|nr:hypothetical protein [Achromobacter xylosoxidans]KWU18071.1 hypothetical protein AS148_14465 [Achromobacter xylosoxidans]
MPEQPLAVTATSPARRRLLLGLASTPLAMCLPDLRPPAPVVLGVDVAGRVDVTATCIRFFDAAGRLRVVIGAFSSSP